VKARLGAYAEGSDSPSDWEGTQRIEELGLLRAQMRLDLDIYSVPYLSRPDPESTNLRMELLDAAGIDPEGWGVPPWRIRMAESIRQTTRHVTARLPPHVPRPTDNSDKVINEAPSAEPPAPDRSARRTT
jgi:hypothetical protein